MQNTPIVISPPDLDIIGVRARLRFKLSGLPHPELWFELPSTFLPLVSRQSDAALVALLLVASARQAPIHLEGPVSPRLLWSLHHTFFSVLERVWAGTPRIEVRAAQTAVPASRRLHVLTGMSCGIDSLCVAADHLLVSPHPASEHITHFLFNDVGGHGHRGDVEARYRARLSRARRFCEVVNKPLIAVRSNLDVFYPREESSFHDAHTLRNAAVALLLQQDTKRFLYATAFPWALMCVRPHKELTFSDPILLEALGTEHMDLVQSGANYTRVQKTEIVASLPVAREVLDVCYSQLPFEGINCSRCEKCLRTQLTLELLGRLEDFSAVFDLRVYRDHRNHFLLEVLSKNEPLSGEVRELLEKSSLPVERRIRALAALRRQWLKMPGKLRQCVAVARRRLNPPKLEHAACP